jgi:two-component system, cell cycle sensor histidine kinase and response regulator CckA
MASDGERLDMPRARDAEYGGPEPLASVKVLVVDADMVRRRRLARALGGEGLEVLVAESGAQAVGMLRGQILDAVVLDSGLPQRGGVHSAKRIKADEAMREVAVVVLGDLDDSVGRSNALRAGAEEYLPRDVDAAELALRLRNLTRLRVSFRELRKRNDALSRLLQEESRRAAQIEQFSRNCLEASHGAVVVLDGQGDVVASNQAWQDYLRGLGEGASEPASASVYRTEQLVADPAVAQQVRETVLRVGRGECEQALHEYGDRSSPPRWIRARMVRLKDSPTPHIMISHEDVTEQRKTKGALDAAAEKLAESQSQVMHAQKMEALGRLVGGVSHDFNNMLTSIICFTRFVVDDMAQEDPRRADLVEVLRAADSAARLTNQLLTFSRRRPVQASVLDLNAALITVGRVLRRTLGESIELVVLPSDEAVYAMCDAGQFDQLLFSLALHAKDVMMPAGGTVTIKLGLTERAEQERVELIVSDTSQGLSVAQIATAFEPFAELRLQRGSGLDIAACAGIVQQVGGEISVASELGRGTTFRVLLPRVHEARRSDAARPSRQAPPGLHGTVLVVEDQPAILRTMARALSSAGLTVLEASSAEDALAVLSGRDGLPELVVTDMMLPGMSGTHLVERLRASAPELRVVYVSGYAGDDAQQSVRVDERTAFVPKPFTGRQLVSRAASLFQLR